MATHQYFFGLVAVLGAIACTSAADDGDDDDNGDSNGRGSSSSTNGNTNNNVFSQGGAATSNAQTGQGNNANTGNTGNIFATTNNTPAATGGVSPTSTTNTFAAGGTVSTTYEPNPNRTISDAEADSITASACNAWAIEPEASGASKLELVIDVSSSMNQQAPGSNRSKWDETRDALLDAVPGPASGGGLPANVSIGMMFYPNMINDQVSSTPTDASVCLNTEAETPMEPLGVNGGGSHRDRVRQALQEIVLGRGTPTDTAYNYVLDNTVLSEAQMAIEGDPYMLLITDGLPTLYKECYNPAGQLRNLEGDPIVASIDAAYQRGVKTFVVGSPGSEEGRAWLSMAAFMGGTAAGGCNTTSWGAPYCHMDMTTAPDFSVALRNGLAQVMSQITTCKFDIPETSADGAQTVDVDRIAPIIRYSNGQITLVGKTTAPSGSPCNDGYRILKSTQMEVCKNTCAELMSDPLATVQFIFGCAPEEIDPNAGSTQQ